MLLLRAVLLQGFHDDRRERYRSGALALGFLDADTVFFRFFDCPPDPSNVTAATAEVTVANVVYDLGQLRLRAMRTNIPGGWTWLLSPRTAIYLQDLTYTSDGRRVFEEMSQGLLRGLRYLVSTNLADDLGDGADEAEVYLINPQQILIGDGDLSLDVSTEAAYHDGSNVVAAFSLDQTVIRVIERHDLAVRHAGSIQILDQVQWGSAA